MSNLVRIVGAVVVLGAALVGAPLHAPSAAADPCPDAEVVFARGSGQPAGLGDVGDAFVAALRDRVPGKSIQDYPVNYPATYDFATSPQAGVQDASAHIEGTIANCPKTQLVLGGYSQGAGVIEMASNSMPAAVTDHVAAVALFGPPTSISGWSNSVTNGQVPTLAQAYQAKSISLCTQDDVVCAASGNILAHLQYIPTKTDEAATFVAGRLGGQ